MVRRMRRRNMPRVFMCPQLIVRGDVKKRCCNYKGEYTQHRGFGLCSVHSTFDEEEVWQLVYDVAKMISVTPWEALLNAVHMAAGRVAWVDGKLERVVRATDGAEDSSEVRAWLRESREERSLMARTAKAAIDAGVNERMVRQVELEGALIAEAIIAGLDAVGMNESQRAYALAVAQQKLIGSAEAPSRVVRDIVNGTIDEQEDPRD